MEILYSSRKNQSNFIKHGVFLAEADKLEWDALIVEKDTRRNYGEDHMIGLAPIGLTTMVANHLLNQAR